MRRVMGGIVWLLTSPKVGMVAFVLCILGLLAIVIIDPKTAR